MPPTNSSARSPTAARVQMQTFRFVPAASVTSLAAGRHRVPLYGRRNCRVALPVAVAVALPRGGAAAEGAKGVEGDHETMMRL